MEERPEKLQEIAPNPIDDVFNEKELKYVNCSFCKGIIPKQYARRSSIVVHCSKICSEMTKMVKGNNYCRDPSQQTVKGKVSAKEWGFYKEVLRERAAPVSAFTNFTEKAGGLIPGMKLEAIDINNPQNYCVATVIQIAGHRICVRYDGFGENPNYDFWCNFQAEELFPIGWCARHGYPLQPPTGITSSLKDWKSFLTRTLTGALAAPNDLFKKVDRRRSLKCHRYTMGTKVEVIHPNRTHLIVPATVSKSLGPYYFLVTTDPVAPEVPSVTFYGYADCPGVFYRGWSEWMGLELCLSGPNSGQEIRMVQTKVDERTHQEHKRSRLMTPFKPGMKLEALHGDYIRIATVAEVYGGRVLLLTFDGSQDIQFVDKSSQEIYYVGWSEKTEGLLYTPHGPVTFAKSSPSTVNRNVSSASFSTFQELADLDLVKPKVDIQPKNETIKNDATSKKPVASSSQGNVSAGTSSTSENGEPRNSEPPSASNTPTLDAASSSSYTSRVPAAKLMSQLINYNGSIRVFIVWLLNNYEYGAGSAIILPQLSDEFNRQTGHQVAAQMRVQLLPMLFPGTSVGLKKLSGKTMVETKDNSLNNVRTVGLKELSVKTMQCIHNLKPLRHEQTNIPIYVKDAVNFLNAAEIGVLMGSEKMVSYMGVGEHTMPESAEVIFTDSKAQPNSNILVISKQIHGFTLSNFSYFFGDKPCAPPFNNVATVNEFRALILLCQLAKACSGVSADEEGTELETTGIKDERTRNYFSATCNLLVYPGQGAVCPQCLCLQLKESPDIDDPLYKDEELAIKDEEHVPCPDIQVFINRSCFNGTLFNKEKMTAMEPKTPLDRPAEVLKCLVEKLIYIADNQDKFLEVLELGFGSRIFNKFKGKVVKKGLFRFNTPKKVVRFLARLTNRLGCCEGFLSLEDQACNKDCHRAFESILSKNTKKEVKQETHENSSEGKRSPAVTNGIGAATGYRLYTNSGQVMVNSPTQVNHYLAPPNAQVQYMVLSKDNMVFSPSVVTPSTPLTPATPVVNGNTPFSSPPVKVSQMIDHVSNNAPILSDIDNPPPSQQLHGYRVASPQKPQQYGGSGGDAIYHHPNDKQHKVQHKIHHHGNARVKYVEMKEEMVSPQPYARPDKIFFQQNHHPQQQQQFQHNSPSGGQQHLNVPTSLHGPMRSPPALGPPPSLHSRQLPMNSPPSLIASPEMRPRFEFQQQQGASGNNSPGQYQQPYMHGKTFVMQSHTGVRQPPPSYVQNYQPSNAPDNNPRLKFHHIDAVPPRSKYGSSGQPLNTIEYKNPNMTVRHGSPSATSGQKTFKLQGNVCIPINNTAAASKDNKFVYFPVKQPVVLYQQQTSDNKLLIPVQHPPQDNKQRNKDGNTSTTFTTVRIQGVQPANQNKNNIAGNKRPVKYQFAASGSQLTGQQIVQFPHNNLSSADVVKMTSSFKDDRPSTPTTATTTVASHVTNGEVKVKKKKVKINGVGNENTPEVNTLFHPPNTPRQMAKRALTEAFRKKRGVTTDDGNTTTPRISFLDDPLTKAPDLPPNPETWSPADVKKFLSVTECSKYADILFKEELDGGSFLLITREALMEFTGIRLGPALKIASYAAHLRARMRLQNVPMPQKDTPTQQRPPKKRRKQQPTKQLIRAPTQQQEVPSLENKGVVAVDGVENNKIPLDTPLELTMETDGSQPPTEVDDDSKDSTSLPNSNSIVESSSHPNTKSAEDSSVNKESANVVDSSVEGNSVKDVGKNTDIVNSKTAENSNEMNVAENENHQVVTKPEDNSKTKVSETKTTTEPQEKLPTLDSKNGPSDPSTTAASEKLESSKVDEETPMEVVSEDPVVVPVSQTDEPSSNININNDVTHLKSDVTETDSTKNNEVTEPDSTVKENALSTLSENNEKK